MKAIKTIVCYPNLLPFEPTEANVATFMATLAEAGVTHVQVNHLPDLMHPEQINQPDNVYLWFANFAPPLYLYVNSQLSAGLYPEMLLERNRRTLLRFCTAARQHGIKPLLYLCEPRFMPERFFQKHPTLRGPRVDNPTCSTTPLFALCTDLPEVRTHYREMMVKMLNLVPDLAMISLFTSDSGAGFDYNPEAYAGPNGAGFNRGFPLEKRVANFLGLLAAEGQKRNPNFTVNLTSGFSPEGREKILNASPAGVVGSVYGTYDWEGGLEAHWGYHQAVWGVPKAKWNIRNLDRVAAHADRVADMQARFDVAARGGRAPIVHAEIPSLDYPRPLRYTPHPFETIRILKDIVNLGATKIAAWGVISPRTLVPHDVNRDAMKAINADIHADAEAVVRRIAVAWVGRRYADVLVAAWRKCDDAWTERPLWTHNGLSKPALPGPLVPDITRLKATEIAYYRTVGLDELERIQGIGSHIPYEVDERNRDFVLHEMYEKATLPRLRTAASQLERAAHGAPKKVAAILRRQAEHIRFAWLIQRSHYNWYEAGRYLAPGARPGRDRSMRQIVDDEMAVTRALIQLLAGRQEIFMRTMPSDYMTYEFGPGFVDHLAERLKVMQAHRNDRPKSLADRLGKMHAYLKDLTGSDA